MALVAWHCLLRGTGRIALGEYHSQKQALSRYYIGAMVLTDPVLQLVRRELRRMFPDVRIEADEIKTVMTAEVMKREVVEGDQADEARKRVAKSANKVLKEKAAKKEADSADPGQEEGASDVSTATDGTDM